MTSQPKPRPSAEDRIKAALWFAERGFGVFPCWSTSAAGRCRCPRGAACTSPGKHPVTPDGFHDATTEPARIRTFLSAASEPNYGLVPPEGVFIWDVDTDEERATLAANADRYGPLSPTLRDTTAHGEHVFLRWPEGIPRPLGRMFGLVTRWGSGRSAGYVIGPASVHADGTVYRSAPGSAADIALLPEAWAQAAVGEDDVTGTIRIGPVGIPPEDVGVGHRHDYLRDTARHYAGTVRDPDALFAAVWTVNERLTQPKSADEVRRAIGEVLVRFPADQVEQDPDTGQLGRVIDDELGMLPPPITGTFPPPPDAAAFAGLLGECALALGEGTDASLVGLLGSLIPFCGAMVPGMAYWHRAQTSSPYVALVGESGIGRKGTAMMRAHDALAGVFGSVEISRAILDGLSSGEGLIATLAYKQTTFPREPTVGLVFEEEFATLIAARSRDGSTLDPKLRAAFDGGPLSNRKASETRTVTPPYWLPALIAITPTELRRRLEPGAIQSGSANRWLHLPVLAQDVPPRNAPPVLTDEQQTDLDAARRLALERRGPLGVAPAVTDALDGYYRFLGAEERGTALDLSRRLPTIAFRLALVHALVERSSQVTADHLERALALTEYARSGIPWVFAGATSNPDADLLLRALQKSGGLRKHTITRELIRDPLRRQAAIDELVRLGEAVLVTTLITGGRPREELRLGRKGRDPRSFVHYFGFSVIPSPDVASVHAGRNGRKSVGSVDESWTKAGRKLDESGRNQTGYTDLDESRTKVWTKLDESLDETGRKSAPGQTGVTWASPCEDYRSHRSAHRRTPGGWVCDVCQPRGGAA